MTTRLRRVFVLLAAFVCYEGAALGQSSGPTPPVAKRVDYKQVWHGETVIDPYFWLREKSHPDVAKYLEAENAYTEAMTAGLVPFRDALYKEMLSRIKQTDLGVPVRDGKFYYYSRTVEGQQYPLYCRKPASEDGSYRADAPEFVMLDQNEMAKGLKFLGLGALQVSDDGNLLAYSTDTTGFRQHTLHVKALTTPRVHADTAERVTSVEWANDNQTLFYVTEDKVTKRPNQLWRLKLGTAPVLVYEEKDELFGIGVGRTKDKRYLVLAVNSTDTWENRCLDAATPEAPLRTVLPREKGHKYSVEHRDGLFYILTNKGAKNFRMVTAPAGQPGPENWKEFIPHRPDVLLGGLELFKDFAVAVEQSQGLGRLRVFDFAKAAWRELSFPEPIYTAFPGGTPEFNSPTFRVSYQSMVTPPSVYDYSLATLERTLMKQQEVLGGYDPAQYVTERIWATARDGVKVPISLVYKKGVARDGTAPLWLYGYGSYGYGQSPTFSGGRLSLLDRGVVYAIAHIRGGNEMGEEWHDDGKLMKKKNTFTDFIACAEYLLAQKWAAKDRLADRGRERRRAADGRRRQHAARSLQGGALRRPVRGRDEHDAGRDAAADGGRVPRVGQPEREAGVRLHAVLQPVRQPGEEGLPDHAGHDQLQRQPGDVLGAGEVRRQTADPQDRRQPAAAQDQHGAGGPRRRLGPLRSPEGHGVRVRLDAEAGGDHEVGCRRGVGRPETRV